MPYVTFEKDLVYTIREDAAALEIPIRIMNAPGKSFTVQLENVDNTAQVGVHYSLVEPATGVLEFSETDTVKIVKIQPLHVDGYNDPGKWDFSLKIASATENVGVGALSACSITVTDAEHPLSSILGAYSVVCYDVVDSQDGPLQKFEYTMNLSSVDGDVTKVACDKIMPLYETLAGYLSNVKPAIGVVSADRSTITFGYGQEIFAFSAGNGGQCILFGGARVKNGDNYGWYTDEDDVVFTKDADGNYVNDTGFGAINDYVWPTYGGFILGKESGVQTVWTKQ